jgi:hypothetical protein
MGPYLKFVRFLAANSPKRYEEYADLLLILFSNCCVFDNLSCISGLYSNERLIYNLSLISRVAKRE